MKLTETPSSPHFLAMSEEEQEFLAKLAQEMLNTLEDAERALASRYEGQLFDIDEGLAFWDLLPAKVKTAIKRGREKPAQACAECGLTGTHTRHCSIGGRFA